MKPKVAILVIDVQNVMFGKPSVYNGNNVLSNIKSIIETARDISWYLFFLCTCIKTSYSFYIFSIFPNFFNT